MPRVQDLKIKIFADGADIKGILEMDKNPLHQGFTTNPTLMRKAGVTDYETFARNLLEKVTHRPISFEVFADDLAGMIAQGRTIASWGKNVNVKVPVTNTKGEFTGPVLRALAADGVETQRDGHFDRGTSEGGFRTSSIHRCRRSCRFLPAVLPIPASIRCRICASARRFWRSASEGRIAMGKPPRALNIFQADEIGCHIITCTNDMIAKLVLVGKDLAEYSRETVQMFYRDATASAFSIDSTKSRRDGKD